MNIDITLNSDILRARTITDYKSLKFCTNIPGCYFSSACINVLELNKFPRYGILKCNSFITESYIFIFIINVFLNLNRRSITACLRMDIFSKKRLWQLNYDCVAISTELPTILSNGTMSTTVKTAGMSTTMNAGMTSAMTTSKITTTTMITTIKNTERTTPRDVEVITVPGNESTTVVDIDK